MATSFSLLNPALADVSQTAEGGSFLLTWDYSYTEVGPFSCCLESTLTLKQLPSLAGIGSADWGDCWLGFSYHKIVNYLFLIDYKFKKGMMAGERGIA